jgi:hypothetical protein
VGRLPPRRLPPVGWALLVEGELVEVELTDVEPLLHYRGRYRVVD